MNHIEQKTSLFGFAQGIVGLGAIGIGVGVLAPEMIQAVQSIAQYVTPEAGYLALAGGARAVGGLIYVLSKLNNVATWGDPSNTILLPDGRRKAVITCIDPRILEIIKAAALGGGTNHAGLHMSGTLFAATIGMSTANFIGPEAGIAAASFFAAKDITAATVANLILPYQINKIANYWKDDKLLIEVQGHSGICAANAAVDSLTLKEKFLDHKKHSWGADFRAKGQNIASFAWIIGCVRPVYLVTTKGRVDVRPSIFGSNLTQTIQPHSH